MLYFPIYKYGVFNSGIGKLDSFPSIIDKQKKQNFIWKLSKENLYNCKKIYLNIDEYFKLRYATLTLTHYNYDFFTNKIVLDISDKEKKLFINKEIKKSNCKITVKNNIFEIKKI